MINTFLKAKHWQLFLLIFALPFLIYIGWMISFFSDIVNQSSHMGDDFPPEILSSITTMLALMIIPFAIRYAWFWSMAVGLQNKIPSGVKMNVPLFKVFFIIPLLYFLFYMLIMITFLSNIQNLEEIENIEDIVGIGWLIGGIFVFIFLSLLVAFCTFYQYWFIGKTIKTAELQREVKFGEFVGEFFLVWFYPIGVWILQPMVNRIIEGSQKKELE